MPAASGLRIHAPEKWKEFSNSPIRVSTYNIHRAEGLDDKTDINRIADLLRQDDISGLQEVLGSSLFGGPDQGEQIAKINNFGWLFAPIQKRYYRNHIGNALLSRYPVTSWSRKPLVWTDTLDEEEHSRRYRNVIEAEIIIGDHVVKIIVTHLDRGDIRETQLKRALENFDQEQRAILMGDLNSDLTSLVMSEWLAKNSKSDAIGIALGDKDAENRIDWILTRGFNVTNGGIEPVGVSDHPYYWVELMPE